MSRPARRKRSRFRVTPPATGYFVTTVLSVLSNVPQARSASVACAKKRRRGISAIRVTMILWLRVTEPMASRCARMASSRGIPASPGRRASAMLASPTRRAIPARIRRRATKRARPRIASMGKLSRGRARRGRVTSENAKTRHRVRRRPSRPRVMTTKRRSRARIPSPKTHRVRKGKSVRAVCVRPLRVRVPMAPRNAPRNTSFANASTGLGTPSIATWARRCAPPVSVTTSPRRNPVSKPNTRHRATAMHSGYAWPDMSPKSSVARSAIVRLGFVMTISPWAMTATVRPLSVSASKMARSPFVKTAKSRRLHAATRSVRLEHASRVPTSILSRSATPVECP